MKNFLSFTLLIGIAVLFCSSAPYSKSPLDTFKPPGTVRVDDHLWFDKTEITNFNWLEYQYWTKKEYGIESEEYIATLTDTAVWYDQGLMNDPYVSYYHSHPAYNSYPVVGVSYEQAQEYCVWRTNRVRQFYEIRKEDKPNFYIPKSFTYRLPTKEEWESVARADYSEKTIKKLQSKKFRDTPRYNMYREVSKDTTVKHFEGTGIRINDNPDITAPSYSYWPNEYGIYNLFGNVAEMVSEPSIAKGGSFKTPYGTIDPLQNFEYEKSHSWLGFRCVCVVEEE